VERGCSVSPAALLGGLLHDAASLRLTELTGAVVQGKSKVQFYLRDGRAFMFKMPPDISPYKYVVYIYKLQADIDGREMTFYGI
jgi:hypothetical protein